MILPDICSWLFIPTTTPLISAIVFSYVEVMEFTLAEATSKDDATSANNDASTTPSSEQHLPSAPA